MREILVAQVFRMREDRQAVIIELRSFGSVGDTKPIAGKAERFSPTVGQTRLDPDTATRGGSCYFNGQFNFCRKVGAPCCFATTRFLRLHLRRCQWLAFARDIKLK